MEIKSSKYWDHKYKQGLPSLTKPDPFFLRAYNTVALARNSEPGFALDIAGGLGRHALYLANKGWRVSVNDISAVAIETISQKAKELGLSLNLTVGDAATQPLVNDSFDLIVLFYHLDRRIFQKIVAALRPGGLLICKMRMRWPHGEEENGTDSLLNADELPTLLPSCATLEHHQRRLSERKRGVLEYIGEKLGT